MNRFFLFGKTDQGLHRTKNEDAILVDQDRGFCLVADGIGGSAAGEVASQMFAKTALEVFSTDQRTGNAGADPVQTAFQIANDRILAYAQNTPACKGMGCTAELLALRENYFVLGHMGDSRTYRLRKGVLKRLTKDHSLVQDQLEQGLITKEEARHHSFKNVILRAVGIQKNPSLDILRGNTFPGDVFLLCSDGLSDMIADNEIKTHLASSEDIKKKVTALIDAANASGGKDNISVVLVQIL